MRPTQRIAIEVLMVVIAGWFPTQSVAVDSRKPEVLRTDIHVDGGRPLAGERSRMAVDSQGNVFFTYTLTAHKLSYLALGKITSEGKVSLDAVGSETTWNVEGWGTVGWPSDIAVDHEGMTCPR